jgi:ferredoxin--NADP+ reductase
VATTLAISTSGSSMFKIVEARFLAPDIKLFVIEAPRVARKRQAGQFVILRVNETGERIPITIAASDPEQGTITLVVQGIGKTTKMLNELETGDSIANVLGPLGRPSKVEQFGTVVVVGGGVGTAIAYPTAVAMKQAGNRVLSIVGARTKELLILVDEMKATSDRCFIMTDDGTAGEHGFVTAKLQELVEGKVEGETVDHVLAIGPVPMMRAVADVTRSREIETVVSLNSIMVDGTGMCGGCRVAVGGKTQFACVDGPEFNAHEVDFDVLSCRNRMYLPQEKDALDRFEKTRAEQHPGGDKCKLDQLAEKASRA